MIDGTRVIAMGLLGNLFKKASGADYSLLNDKVYNIRKCSQDPHMIEIWLDGRLDRTIPDSNVVILNDQLVSKWPYKYFSEDNFQEMAECCIHESDGVWYIRCSTWTPDNGKQFADRIVVSGPVGRWFDWGEQVFVKRTDEGRSVSVLTSSGEYKTISYTDVEWSYGETDYVGVWYLANIYQKDESSYEIKVGNLVPRALDVIVNGKMVWNIGTLKWEEQV